MKVFLIPGLGYDCRIFEKLDLRYLDIIQLNWIEPEREESLSQYALRFFKQASATSDKIMLIGHSMGGMLAQEIAAVYNIDSIILVSSLKSRKELPFIFKTLKPLGLHQLVTKKLMLKSFKLWANAHDFKTEALKSLFVSMTQKLTNNYLQWALRELSAWQRPKLTGKTKVFHIHGNKDKTLPYGLIENPNFTIKGGSHICLLTQANEVSQAIQACIEESKLNSK
ncbi:MAG: alpha/beta hydrolase [Bacteroidia bacterium]